MNFVSKDKKTINLPVPLDSEVYEFRTDCINTCYFQKKRFYETFPPNSEGHCDFRSLCHTEFCGVDTVTLSMNNLSRILENWGVKIFETKEEAEKAGRKIASEHSKDMKKLGFKIKKDTD